MPQMNPYEDRVGYPNIIGVTSSATVTSYAMKAKERTLAIVLVSSNNLAVTLPPVNEAMGKIYAISLDVLASATATINDAGDDPLQTEVTLDTADDYWVGYSDGRRWYALVTNGT